MSVPGLYFLLLFVGPCCACGTSLEIAGGMVAVLLLMSTLTLSSRNMSAVRVRALPAGDGGWSDSSTDGVADFAKPMRQQPFHRRWRMNRCLPTRQE
jgi:hypothetical protein